MKKKYRVTRIEEIEADEITDLLKNKADIMTLKTVGIHIEEIYNDKD